MAGKSADHVFRQVRRGLAALGAVGSMSDAQLLNLFTTEQSDSAEAALMNSQSRHGPMVSSACRGEFSRANTTWRMPPSSVLVLAEAGRRRRRDVELACQCGFGQDS